MTVANQDFKVYRGNTTILHIGLKNADGTPFDTTIPGLQARFCLAPNWHSEDEDVLVKKQIGHGVVLVSSGVDITMETSDTDFPPGFYYYEVKVWDGVDVATTTTGTAIIKKAIRMGDESVNPPAAQRALSTVAPTRSP